MGSGATKTNSSVQFKNDLFSPLAAYLNQLQSQLDLLSSAPFSTIDEMNALDIKKSIDLLQSQINAELITVRKVVKERRSGSVAVLNEKRLNELNAQTQDLYMKTALIIKGKIKPYD